MIERLLQPRLLELASRYPVINLTGPRQSGKTTLSRMAFPDLPYVSLENPAQREFAQEDPVAFLARYGSGAVRTLTGTTGLDIPRALPERARLLVRAPGRDRRPLTCSGR